MGLSAVTGSHVEVTLGIVGFSAGGGGQFQSLMHRVIDSPSPGERNSFLAFEPNFNISLGNVYTHAGAGIGWRN